MAQTDTQRITAQSLLERLYIGTAGYIPGLSDLHLRACQDYAQAHGEPAPHAPWRETTPCAV